MLSFLTRLLDPSTALTKLQEQQHQQQRQLLGGTAVDGSAAATALLQSQLDRVGANLSRMLLGAVVGALPYSRVGDIAPVVQVSRRGWVPGAVCFCAALCFTTAVRRRLSHRDVYVLATRWWHAVFVFLLQATLRLGRDKALQWVRDCMAAIPDVALTAADRDAFMAAAAAVLAGNAGMDGGCEGIEEALEAVSDLCRRNKRASKAAQAALLPVQLHQALGLV